MYFIADYLGSMLFTRHRPKHCPCPCFRLLMQVRSLKDQASYLLEQTIDYVQSNRSYLPVGVRSNAGDEALCYDFNYGQVILKGETRHFTDGGCSGFEKIRGGVFTSK